MNIYREDLLAVLELVRPGLSSKEAIEQSNHFIFNKDEILAYNDELLISYPIDIELQCTVDASLFYKLISRMNQETISLNVKKEKLECKGGKTRASIPIVKESEIFTHIKAVTDSFKDCKWKKLSKDFTDGLKLCAFSALTDRTTGTLTSVRVEGKDVMSGGGGRYSWYEMDDEVEEDFYIEAVLITELSKYEDVTEYCLSASWAHFKSESGVTFSARRVIPLELLPFKRAFEGATDGVRIRIPAGLKESIETANLVNDGEQGVDKLVKLTIEDKKITSEAQSKKGTITQEVEFDKPIKIDAPIEVRIRPNFLMEVLDKSTFAYIYNDRILFKRQAFQHIAALDID
jgi:DNA polymerase III sliding clamp (beta) subunit (PCNA family)